MANKLEVLANSRVNILLVLVGVAFSVSSFLLGVSVGRDMQQTDIKREKQILASQLYTVCFLRERELESYNSQRARRSCEYLKEAVK